MKLLLPLFSVLVLLLAACAPRPRESPAAAHQRKLWEEAHANFLAMKAEERRNAPRRQPAPAPHKRPQLVAFRPQAKPAPQPESRSLFARLFQPAPAPAPAPASKSKLKAQPKPEPFLVSTSKPRPAPVAKARPPRKKGDTVYYWDDEPRSARQNDPRYSAAEARHARELAKSPEDLTSEERLWARTHYGRSSKRRSQ